MTLLRRLMVLVLAAAVLPVLVFVHRAKASDADYPRHTSGTPYSYYDETFRGQYHYSPQVGWSNDPNGLVYYQGEYHLFYQYNPDDTVWGTMHWGHAVSTDLVHWSTLPIALYPDANGAQWSGSVVIDWNNTAGLGAQAMIAVYTVVGTTQQQALAYSIDRGRTWTKYGVVLPNPGLPDFRDPKVFWNAGTSRWVMVVSGGDRMKIYTSSDLKSWTWASDFGVGVGAHGGVWECPDLFPLQVDGGAATKWVLTGSVGGGGPTGGNAEQYFVGSFDGTTFTDDNPASTTLWMDYGADSYAGSSFSDLPSSDGRRIFLSWMNTPVYANQTPGDAFKGAMTVPRQLTLTSDAAGVRLHEQPVSELTSLRGPATSFGSTQVAGETTMLSGLSSDSYEVIADFAASAATASSFGLRLRTGGNQETDVGYDRSASQLFVDRSRSGPSGFNASFAARHSAPLSPTSSGHVTLRVLVDRQSVEAFANNGERTISDLVFPDRASRGLSVYSVGGPVTMSSLTFYPIGKAFGSSPFVSNLTGWRTVNGHWADWIGGRQGRSDGDAFSISSTEAGDFTYETDAKVLGPALGAASLVFRANRTATNGYVANLDVNEQRVKLLRWNGGGSVTTLASVPETLTTGVTYHLKVIAAGTRLQIYLGPTLVIDLVDSAYDSGYLGLNVYHSRSEFQNTSLTGVSGLVSNLPALTPVSGTWSNAASGKTASSTGDGFALASTRTGDVDFAADVTMTSTGGAAALVFRSDATVRNGYVANLDLSGVVRLFKWVNGSAVSIATAPVSLSSGTTYRLRVTAVGPTITTWLNGVQELVASDGSFGNGQLGLNVWNGSARFQNLDFAPTTRSITGNDFETGTLQGWTPSGNAFSAGDVTSNQTFWGGPYNQLGRYHLMGFQEGGDAGTGTLTSETFVLGGTGQIDFLQAGGNDPAHLHVALVRASDGAALFSSTGVDWDGYTRVSWDAWRYIGTACYVQVVDQSTGSWGHVSLDQVDVPVAT